MLRIATTGLCLCALACSLLLAGSASAQGASTTPSEEAAIQAFRQGSFSKAVDLYRQALQETDDATHRARLHINIAWTLFALGREAEVQTHLRAALVEDPNLTLLPDYYTQEFIDLFDRARARGVAVEAPVTAPDLEATVAGIELRVEQGEDVEGALADVDRLLESYPEDGRLIPLKVEALRRLGRDQEADDLLRTYGGSIASGLWTDRMSIPDLILRANRLLEDGDAGTSLELLREAVARQPSNVAALELMAEAAQRSGHWDEAEFALKSALGMQPGNVGLQLRLGEVYIAKNELSAARDVFRSITETSPHSDRGWASLGLLEIRLGNRERALAHLDRAIEENPLLPEVQLARGELLLAFGAPAAALPALEAAANLLHDDPQLEARLGQALLATGRHADALAHLRAAVGGGFDRPDVERALALALALNGLLAESDRALAGAEIADNGDSELVRGILMLERRSWAAAEEILRPVAVSRANQAAVLNLLGAALFNQARYAEAVTTIGAAAELEPDNPGILANLAIARAARTAELLAVNATVVKAAPAN
ncbi:MAG: tetratricopeptide repeat protein [Thermoanaerobaculales bacterium]|jgi:tetratricopeptide (TPR) repeat protein|nr:tetratricopeptide repeat protein [Thermoanaerobaculales bacterium]